MIASAEFTIVPARAEDKHDPMLRVIASCRRWLVFQHPGNQPEIVGLKTAHYGECGTSTGGERLGVFLPAVRSAQYHWAAVQLPLLEKSAAFWRREHKNHWEVTWRLYQKHRAEWNEHRALYPVRSLSALLDLAAYQMALTLGDNPL